MLRMLSYFLIDVDIQTILEFINSFVNVCPVFNKNFLKGFFFDTLYDMLSY